MSMAAFLVIGKRRIRFRFFVIIALLLSGIIYICLGENSDDEYTTVNYGRLDLVYSGQAVIIREETVYGAPAYGRAVYLAADGAAVEINQPIAVLYKENYDEDVVKQLYDIQEKIVKYQQEQLIDQTIDNDIIKVNMEVQIIVSDIQSCVKNKNYTETAKFESRLRKLLNSKQKLLDLESEPDDYLTGLYDKEANLVSEMKQWIIDLKAPESGLLSFTMDGFENILGASAVDKLTSEDYLHIIQQIPLHDSANQVVNEQFESSAQAEQPFLRIIDPTSKWYAALKCDSHEIYLKKGDVLEVVFDEQDSVSGKVNRVHKENGHFLLILEFTEYADKIINKRVLPLRVKKTVEGLILPVETLKKSKGRQGVYLRDKEENRFIETSVQAEQDGYVIVESVLDTQSLRLHDQVLTDWK